MHICNDIYIYIYIYIYICIRHQLFNDVCCFSLMPISRTSHLLFDPSPLVGFDTLGAPGGGGLCLRAAAILGLGAGLHRVAGLGDGRQAEEHPRQLSGHVEES